MTTSQSHAQPHFDAIILGGGLAGSILAQTLIDAGRSVLLVDDPSKSRCSRVAAGLINPIGGKRLKLVWMAEALVPFAKSYYASLSERMGKAFFHPQPLARLFANADEAHHWHQRVSDSEYAPWFSELDRSALPHAFQSDEGFLIPSAGYLDTESLIDAIQSQIPAPSRRLTSPFAYDEIEVLASGVRFREYTADHAIFCEGHLATSNPWFQFVPYKPAKGIIGSIHIDSDSVNAVSNISIHKGKFLVPRHDGRIAVGATYDWDNADEAPDTAGIQELETFLNFHLGNDWRWLDIKAGVRPATAGAYPVVGQHPQHPQLIAFNGFGSKGSLQIPYFAAELAHLLATNENRIPTEARPSRFFRNPEPSSAKRWIATDVAKARVLAHLHPGDFAIDATMGNGHDTHWLAQAVGETGHVFAFDIQPSALATTRARLEKANLAQRATLLLRGHESLAEPPTGELAGKVAAIVFNLGYLPGGDKSMITKPDTTLAALQASLTLLKPNGILSITLYPYHQGGGDETQSVLDWLASLDSASFQTTIEHHPANNPNSPFPAFVRRLK